VVVRRSPAASNIWQNRGGCSLGRAWRDGSAPNWFLRVMGKSGNYRYDLATARLVRQSAREHMAVRQGC